MRVFRRSCRTALALAVALLIPGVFAQQKVTMPGSEFVPHFVTLRPTQPLDLALAETDAVSGDALPTWHGWISHESVNYSFTMLGNRIIPGAGTTTIDVVLIPLKVSFADG